MEPSTQSTKICHKNLIKITHTIPQYKLAYDNENYYDVKVILDVFY